MAEFSEAAGPSRGVVRPAAHEPAENTAPGQPRAADNRPASATQSSATTGLDIQLCSTESTEIKRVVHTRVSQRGCVHKIEARLRFCELSPSAY